MYKLKIKNDLQIQKICRETRKNFKYMKTQFI